MLMVSLAALALNGAAVITTPGQYCSFRTNTHFFFGAMQVRFCLTIVLDYPLE